MNGSKSPEVVFSQNIAQWMRHDRWPSKRPHKHSRTQVHTHQTDTSIAPDSQQLHVASIAVRQLNGLVAGVNGGLLLVCSGCGGVVVRLRGRGGGCQGVIQERHVSTQARRNNKR